MNDRMKSFIELAKADFNQAMHLIDFMPGGKEAILMHTFPTLNIKHRRFFLDAASDPETDPEILHMLGKRDLPNKIRFAVMDNPNTPRKTIEKMARQWANDAVRFRAEKFLRANPESPKGNMMESDNPYLNKIMAIMDDGSVESSIQALELAINFNLEDELLKKIPATLPFSVKLGKRESGASLTVLAGNPNTPTEIIIKLYNEAMDVLSGKPPVYSTGLKLPAENWVFEGYLFNIAHNKNTPKELLIELAKYDKEPPMTSENHAASVRFHVAINDNPPREALMILANDQEEDIRDVARNKLGAPIEESKFRLSTKDIRQIIKEELEDFLSHPVARMMQSILSAAMTANYQTIMKAFEENARTLHIERSALGSHKGSHKKQLLDMLADAMYTYQKSHGGDGLEQLIKIAEDIKFEYETHDERNVEEEPPF